MHSTSTASTTLVIDGTRIDDIATFYAEINRVFMADAGWTLGDSLDALDDMLYGGYGVLAGRTAVSVEWRAFEKNRDDLGAAATRAWLQAKLAQPQRYDSHRIQRQLDALDTGGPSFFDTVLGIFAAHPAITLLPR